MVADDEAAACCTHYSGAFSWVLRNIRRIDIFPVRGKLGIYNVDVPRSTDQEGGVPLD